MSDYRKLRDMDEFYKLLEEMKGWIRNFYENGSAIAVYSFDNIHDRDSIYDFLSNWAATTTNYKPLKLYRGRNIAGDEHYLIFAWK